MPASGTMNLSVGDLTGQPIRAVLPAARVMARFAEPFDIRWCEEFGNRSLLGGGDLPAESPLPEWLGEFLEDLSTIQSHTVDVVRVPGDIDGSMVDEVHGVAQLLRTGEQRGSWETLQFDLNEDADKDEVIGILTAKSSGALVSEMTLVLDLGDQRHELGRVHQTYANVVVADEQPHDRSIRLVSGDDDSYVLKVGPLPRGDKTA